MGSPVVRHCLLGTLLLCQDVGSPLVRSCPASGHASDSCPPLTKDSACADTAVPRYLPGIKTGQGHAVSSPLVQPRIAKGMQIPSLRAPLPPPPPPPHTPPPPRLAPPPGCSAPCTASAASMLSFLSTPVTRQWRRRHRIYGRKTKASMGVDGIGLQHCRNPACHGHGARALKLCDCVRLMQSGGE